MEGDISKGSVPFGCRIDGGFALIEHSKKHAARWMIDAMRYVGPSLKLISGAVVVCASLLIAIAQAQILDDGKPGQGEGVNAATSLAETRRLAEQGDVDAQVSLGTIYYQGLGVPKNYAEALKWLQKAADQGAANAQTDLGGMYYNGQGVEQNYPNALKWFRKAAEQGLASAQLNLGYLHVNEQGTPQSYAEALKWYRKAAELGYADAQLELGWMYQVGQGTLQNYIVAHMWFNLSAALNNKSATEFRRNIASEMTPESVLVAQELAVKCLAQEYKNCGE